MTTCKSIGYEVYRINFRCKCVCHKFKTTTDLPFFIWRTNSTTRKIPETFSPQLYHVVGTISATPIPKMPVTIGTDETTSVDANDTDHNDTEGNTTVGNETDDATTEQAGDDNAKNVTGDGEDGTDATATSGGGGGDDVSSTEAPS